MLCQWSQNIEHCFNGMILLTIHYIDNGASHKLQYMKQLLLAAVIFCTAHVATAQTKTDSLPQVTEKKMEKDGYITLQGGQVMLVKDSKAEKLEKDKTLTDGTVVLLNGMVKKADGTSMQMKEGDRIYLDGGMSLSRKDKETVN